jgi:hypothetical protein
MGDSHSVLELQTNKSFGRNRHTYDDITTDLGEVGYQDIHWI